MLALKALPVVGLIGFGVYFSGVLGLGGYSRNVGRPPAEVMAALEDLDITAQPGAPGSTAEAAGGIKPVFRIEKAVDHLTWYVMSGDKVATKMTAYLEPIDGGKQTHITTRVERGDAPDDFVSPAFRSKSLTMGLFGMAIESEVNKLVTPTNGDPVLCQKIMDQFEMDNMAATARQGEGLAAAIGGTTKTVMRLQAYEAELRRNGCKIGPAANGNFERVQSTMQAAPTAMQAPQQPSLAGTAPTPSNDPTRPGLDPKPMMNLPRN